MPVLKIIMALSKSTNWTKQCITAEYKPVWAVGEKFKKLQL